MNDICQVIRFPVIVYPSAIMKEPIIIKFKDLDTADEAVVIVRYNEASVVVGLSLKANGDMQVVMKKTEARQLIEALEKAISQ